MKKTFITKLIALIFLLSSFAVVSASASTSMSTAEQPVSYKTSITVGADGGKFQVGFINLEFKKDFMKLTSPVTFEAEIYAENGSVYIEFTPDTEKFFKMVHLRVERFEGYVYDRATGENILVKVKQKQILAPHFSHYLVEW